MALRPAAKRNQVFLALVIAVLMGAALYWLPRSDAAAQARFTGDANRAPVVFEGGHETDAVDHGRPVRLIAAGLGVSPEVFRQAFSQVNPAPAGVRPDRARVRENKERLMAALGPHGVTNERLDTVSDYYRYNRSRGEMWLTEPAVAHALVTSGEITGFEIVEGGSGYSSAPVIAVPGFSARAAAHLWFGLDLGRNGSVTAITLLPAGNP